MASFMGNFYEGISEFFLPYPAEPRPFLLTLNAGEKEGVLALEPYDFDYKGGPRLPDRYRPYVAGSPYLRCHCSRGQGAGASARQSPPGGELLDLRRAVSGKVVCVWVDIGECHI